jgi:hypothetical protein
LSTTMASWTPRIFEARNAVGIGRSIDRKVTGYSMSILGAS